MRTRLLWMTGFLLLYGLHTFFYSMHQVEMERVSRSYIPMLGAVVTLAGLLALIVADFLRRDEVVRRMALIGGSAAALVSSLFSFAIDMVSVPSAIPIWAVAMLVFLIVYGGLQWRAKL